MMLATGAILLGSTNFLPQLGYTATWAGLVAFLGGVVMMVMMLVVGRVSGRVQPKVLIIAGAVIIAVSMYDLTNIYADLGSWFFADSRILFSLGLPLIFARHSVQQDELLRRPRQLTLPSTEAGHPVDRKADAEPGLVPQLYRWVLGPDGDRAGDGAARAAQDQARRQGPHGALSRSLTLYRLIR
jgi:hypothetical protein